MIEMPSRYWSYSNNVRAFHDPVFVPANNFNWVISCTLKIAYSFLFSGHITGVCVILIFEKGNN